MFIISTSFKLLICKVDAHFVTM